MKYVQLPEFNSEFEVVKDLKLRAVLPKRFSYYHRVNSAEEELETVELKKGARIIFSGISDRFSPYIHTKGYKFKKISTSGNKGMFLFIMPFDGIDPLKVRKVEPSELTEKKSPAQRPPRVTWFQLEGIGFNINLSPDGQDIRNVDKIGVDKTRPVEPTFQTHLKFGISTEPRYTTNHRVECEVTLKVEYKKKNIIQGTGFDAKPVKEERVIMSNLRIKVLGKTFELTEANIRNRTLGKEASLFLTDMISKGIIS